MIPTPKTILKVMRENDINNKHCTTTPTNQETNGHHSRYVESTRDEVGTNQHHGLLFPVLPLLHGDKGTECVKMLRLVDPPLSPPFSDMKAELPRGDKGNGMRQGITSG